MSWIVDEIEARGGEVTFDVFMELALYHPQHGYYSRAEPRCGRGGDFLTAPTASEWYARVLARLLTSISAATGPLHLIDLASGDGALISGLFEALGPKVPDVLGEVTSIERSPSMRDLQKARLAGAVVPVRWAGNEREIEALTEATVVHASELYDALPVVRVAGDRGGLAEMALGVDSGGLAWRRRPARPEVEAYFASHGIEIEEGQIAEANLDAAPLHSRLLTMAGGNGASLVLDYGYEARRLYDARGRGGGSLTTFRRHQLGRDPLIAPGEVDLTAHVNWDDLRVAASAAKWTEIELWPLAEFLIRSGLEQELESRGLGMEADLDATTVSARQEVKRLLDPEGMGSDLKMLVQAKGDMIEVARKVLSLD
jgi:SAM-dependent MidA family methyltransferase